MSNDLSLQIVDMFYNENMNLTEENTATKEPAMIVDFLEIMFHGEIANRCTRRGNTLTVYLSDQTVAKIVAPKVPRDTLPPRRTEALIENLAVARYVMQHDYGYGKDDDGPLVINKLELRNLAECQMYVVDACRTQLNAYYTDGLIEFYNGEKFQVHVKLAEKSA